MSRRAWGIFVFLWLALLAGSLWLDEPAKRWLYAHRFGDESAGVLKGTPLAYWLKMIGDIRVSFLLAALILIRQRFDWRRAGALLLCVSTAWLADFFKWAAGRERPVDLNGKLTDSWSAIPFVTREAGNTFCSGHTMLAFATAAFVARYYPRWTILAFTAASIVAAERILELAHHISDVVAGAGLGILAGTACLKTLESIFPTKVPVSDEEVILK